MFAVAGVTGNTGAAIARALLDAGEAVRVIVRRAEAGAPWRALGAEVAVADLTDATALTAALRGTQGAWLLNPPAYGAADPYAQAGAVGRAAAAAIAASGVPRAVVLSSVGSHLDAGTGIIRTNHQLEQALGGVTSPVAFLRARYFFENWAHVLDPVRGAGVLPSFLGPVDRRFSMVPVADIAQAAVELLRGPAWTGRRVVELSSFEASPADVAQALAAAQGKAVAPAIVPREQWGGILGGNGFSPAVVDAFVEMYDGINRGVVAPEAGTEARRGGRTLAQAAEALLAA